MKKILSFLAAGVLAFGLIGCSGDLHDLETLDFSKGGIPGVMNGWDNTTTWTSADASTGTYTYEFKATGTSISWKAIAEAGNWNSGAFGGEGTDLDVPADGTEVALIYDNKTGGGKNCKSDGLEENATYKITLTIEGADAKAKLEKIGGATAIVPYYFDGMYLCGSVFGIKEGSTAWDFSTENLIYGAKTDSQTGVVTYTKDITATAASGELGINDINWKNKQLGSGITITADAEEATDLDGEEGNFKVENLTVGSPYRVEITTTPEKVVSVKIYEIASVTLKFVVTGLTEGDSAWINGSMWGSDWPQKWPIVAWNSNDESVTEEAINAHPAAVADASGVATFDSSWDTSFVSKIGDTKSYSCKVVCIAEGGDWDEDGAVTAPEENISFDWNVEGGDHVVTIDATTWKVTVK